MDAYGHVSLRDPDNPEVFIMSGDKAPALVSTSSDLIHYNVSDSSPVDPNAKKGYQERFIHSEIYKRFPHINSVIHSHSEAVLPFTMNGVPMQPAFHIAGFLGIISHLQIILYHRMTLRRTRNSRPNIRHHTSLPTRRRSKFSRHLPAIWVSSSLEIRRSGLYITGT